MIDFQFVLPRVNSDLLNSDGNNYFVKQKYNPNEITQRLQEASRAFRDKRDPFFLFDHFDTFFSIIEYASHIPIMTLMRALDMLCETADRSGRALDEYFKQKELDKQMPYLNLVKMLLYLMVSTVRAADAVIKEESNDAMGTKRAAKKQTERSHDLAYDDRRYDTLQAIFHMLELPLERLWTMAIAEEDFITLIVELPYRTLEHPSIKATRVNEIVFRIIGVAIKRYNHALSFSVRTTQILASKEIAVVPIANGVRLLNDEFKIHTAFEKLLDELTESLNAAATDQLIAKHFSMFLTHVCEIAPKLIIPHLSQMGEDLLNLDPYLVRNCVLGIMGQIIIKELTSEDLTDEQKTTRDEFLDNLLQHMNDISGYVRSKVLQIWNEMKTERAVPLKCQLQVVATAIERLEDKTALVRKNAVALLKSFLETNPFSAKLSLEEIKTKFEEESIKLQELRDKMVKQDQVRPEIEKTFNEETSKELRPIIEEALKDADAQTVDQPIENSSERAMELHRLLNDGCLTQAVKLAIQLDAVNQTERLAMEQEQQILYITVLLRSYLFVDHTAEYDKQSSMVDFFSDCLDFSRMITEAVPKIEEFLLSKTNSDVFEAIEFFTTGYLFNIKNTEHGVRRTLNLLWTGDKDKRAAVTDAYNRILFQTDSDGRTHAIRVVNNLCTFFQQINTGEYFALETLIKEWLDNSTINAAIIQVFFERLTMKLPNTTDNMARICLQYLIMISNAKPTVVTANKDLIISILCGEQALADPRIFGSSLELLIQLAPPSLTDVYKRFDRTDEVVEKVTEHFVKIFFFPKILQFEPIASQTISFFYRLCQSPDLICQDLLLLLSTKIKDIVAKTTPRESLSQATSSQSSANGEGVLRMPTYLLARLIFVFGCVAMQDMIFLDIDVYNNMKYREDLKKEKNDMKKKINKRKSHMNNLNSSASDALKRLSTTAAEPQQEPDEMLIGATAEDRIADEINRICEQELVNYPNGLLYRIVPVVEDILSHPSKYHDSYIQATACLTLTRFMTVSSEFCHANMSFLMNILQQTKSVTIKCNIIVALSDFTCRFPNVIEPWTSNLYSTLLEPNVTVRLTAVKMLAHLILQEMIRVRGQLSDMAVCIVDPDPQIQIVTKTFFKEIANKSNILYNVLPDILSRLSSSDSQVEEEKYRIIMKHIMSLIQKDRQVESLVEKLCLRFRITNSERQWRDIAYCLSLLTYTERTIKKLTDHIPNYRDKVQYDEVYDCFKTIISNTNKLAKPEMKNVVKEFENKLQECLEVRENGEMPMNRMNDSSTIASGSVAVPSSTQGKRGTKVQAKTKKNTDMNSSDSEDDFEFAEPLAPAPRAHKRGCRVPVRRVERKVIDTASDDDENDENVPVQRSARKKRHR